MTRLSARWRRGLGAAGLVMIAGMVPARAQHLPAVESAHYDRCMDKTRRDPGAALDDATAWRENGGAHPAEHCAAVALIGLKRYTEAATRLEKLAEEMFKSPANLRAEVLDQAGQAWLLAGNAPRSAEALSQALAIQPNDPDLLTDRAEAFAAQSKYQEAITDLDQALSLAPNRVDALVFRAAAHRKLQQLDPALQDAEAALRLAPDDPDALLERGNIRRLKGDNAGARSDWQRILEVAPKSAADADAKANIKALDANPNGAPPAARPATKKPAAKKSP